jgi:hypothetical protein
MMVILKTDTQQKKPVLPQAFNIFFGRCLLFQKKLQILCAGFVPFDKVGNTQKLNLLAN